MKQTWFDIYNQKATRELLKILRDGSIDEKELANKVLNNRNFDWNNISKYKEEFELEDLLFEEEMFNNSILQRFKNSIFGFDFLPVIPIFNILGIVIVIGSLIFQIAGLIEKDLINTIIGLFGLILLEFVTIKLYIKREKRINFRKNRIRDLKNKLGK